MKIVNSIGVVCLAAAMLGASAAGPSLAAECYEQAPLRPVTRTFVHRDVLEPGVYSVGRRPSLYGWHVRRVRVHAPWRWAGGDPSAAAYLHERILLRPYRNYAHFDRPYIHRWRERIAIEPEGSGWRGAPAGHGC